MQDVMATVITTTTIPFHSKTGDSRHENPSDHPASLVVLQVTVIVSTTNNFICYIKCPPLTKQQQNNKVDQSNKVQVDGTEKVG